MALDNIPSYIFSKPRKKYLFLSALLLLCLPFQFINVDFGLCRTIRYLNCGTVVSVRTRNPVKGFQIFI